MTKYIDMEPLKAEIKRLAEEITRLLEENKELKERVEKANRTSLSGGRIAGQNEAWELAQKVYLLPESGGYNSNELIEIFGTASTGEILRYTYAEAAAKVAEWERKKEEICVGDIVNIRNANICGVVTYKGTTDNTMDVMTPTEGTIFVEKKDCTKTGRHIDIASMLAQIGGGSDE